MCGRPHVICRAWCRLHLAVGEMRPDVIMIGHWYGLGAQRTNITGWLKAPVPVLWNIDKN
jgi:hypothetical protein